MKLDSHHRTTLEKIFEHPGGHNIEWHDVLSLLEGLQAVTREHDGRLRVALGSATEMFDPHGRDLDEQQVVDLRRMLRNADITPEETD